MEVNSNETIYVMTEQGRMLWGEPQLRCFVMELLYARSFVDFDDEVSVEKVLTIITVVMTSIFRHRYNVAFMITQFSLLYERYELFKYVIKFPCVTWRPSTNQMNIPFYTKMALVHLKPETETYFRKGEPLWDDLQFLFDDPNIWKDDPRLISPSVVTGLFDVPQTHVISDEPIMSRMREREYKKIFNERLTRGE